MKFPIIKLACSHGKVNIGAGWREEVELFQSKRNLRDTI